MLLKITPVAKPRQTQSDRWKQRPVVMKYRAFADELRELWGMRDIPTHDIHIIFRLPMPISWSKKKKTEMDGEPHQVKPDKDNLEKAFWDALFRNLPEDDCMIYDARVTKLWDREGSIEFKEMGDNTETIL